VIYGPYRVRLVKCGGRLNTIERNQHGRLYVRRYTSCLHRSWRITKDGEYVFSFSTKRAAITLAKRLANEAQCCSNEKGHQSHSAN
jgi:hypothetical protein